MKQSLMNAIAAMIILSLPLSSFGAETVKLRSIVSVYYDSKAGSIKLPEGVACSEKSVLL